MVAHLHCAVWLVDEPAQAEAFQDALVAQRIAAQPAVAEMEAPSCTTWQVFDQLGECVDVPLQQ